MSQRPEEKLLTMNGCITENYKVLYHDQEPTNLFVNNSNMFDRK